MESRKRWDYKFLSNNAASMNIKKASFWHQKIVKLILTDFYGLDSEPEQEP
jgi:hypothetical protein